MPSSPRFSLAFLFLETFWIALALGLTRLEWSQDGPALALLIVAVTGCYGIALWHLLRRLNIGVIESGVLLFGAFVPYSLLTPVVMR